MAVVSTTKYLNPEGHLSLAQGSAEVLSNGNVLAGWGTVPQFTEFAPDGEVLWHVHLDSYDPSHELLNMQNYRVFKAPWVGKPTTEPKLVAYRRGCEEGPLVGYASWNGATEVKFWRFSVSSKAEAGAWRKSVVVKKEGFETMAVLGGEMDPGLKRWVKVEALDGKHNVLASTVAETFVPGEEVSEGCDELGCAAGHEWFEYDGKMSVASTCPLKAESSHSGSLMMFGLVVVVGVVYMRYLMKKRRGGGSKSASQKNMEMFVDEEKAGRWREKV